MQNKFLAFTAILHGYAPQKRNHPTKAGWFLNADIK